MANDQIRKLIKSIQTRTEQLVRERDALRTLHQELHDLLEDCDQGVDEIQNGLRDIESGIDTISQTI